MFEEWRRNHPTMPELQRPARYRQLEFSVELMKQLAGLTNDETVPVYNMNNNNNLHPMKPK